MVDYEVIENTLRINAMNWAIEPSIEDSEACMAVVIDTLLETKGVERIVIVETREREYDYEQVKLLKEIANAYNKILNEEKLISINKFGPSQCEKLFPRRLSELQFLVTQVLRKDPIGAYVMLEKMILREKMMAEKFQDQTKLCHTEYLEKVLLPMEKILSSCTLIQIFKSKLSQFKPGDRSFYRQVFRPLIRPNFMLTRYMIMPPKDGISIQKYFVGKTSVEIFKVPGKIRYVYHVIPPEFTLSEDKYMILDLARRYLAEHRPSEREFTEPEKAREVFMSIGRDLIRDIARSRGVELSSQELEELAEILARYTAGFGILEVLLADEKVQDVYINSPIGSTPIFINHAEFEECETNLLPTKEDADAWATRFRLYSGRPLDEANPVLDTELLVPGGRARVAAITRTLSPYGLGYAFRRHRDKPWTFPLFIKAGFFDSLYAGVMSFIVDGGRSLLVAGGRGSGKTSLLGAIMLEVMKKFRLCLVEDTLELPAVQLMNLGYNIERLKSRSVITRVEAELPAEEALRTALRLGDSVLIIGEVRSSEALALFEAMRIGALANLVAGTIHGESAYGVYDRVVNDLKVPPTSFKALDAITICNLLKTPDGLRRFRRVTELTEVRKHWKQDPLDEGGFVTLMEYSAKEDRLKPTDTLINGESYVLNEIAKRVREWHGNWDAVWDNILLRAKIRQTMVDFARELGRDDILEAEMVVQSNEMFHMISEQVREEVGGLDSKMIYERWLNWFKEKIKR
ncbi:MAG: type II/IV secretion system ATPase subunit [Candidatus Aenigmatarchaeota archaeon]